MGFFSSSAKKRKSSTNPVSSHDDHVVLNASASAPAGIIQENPMPSSPLVLPSGQPARVDESDLSLFVNLLECKNLKAADLSGYSDPYCILTLDGNERDRSEIVMKSLNPVFNSVFSVSLPMGELYPRDVTLSFWDWDMGPGKDDFLGQVVIPIKDVSLLLSPKNPTAPHPTTSPPNFSNLPSQKSSFLQPQLKAPEPTWAQLQQRKKSERVSGDARYSIWMGRKEDFAGAGQKGTVFKEPLFRYIKVHVIEARNLMAADKTGTSDPYVAVKLGDQKALTKSKRCELNPVWRETFLFVTEGEDLRGKVLTMDVMDWDDSGENDSLGSIQFDLGELAKKPNGVQDAKQNVSKMDSSWYQLKTKGTSRQCQGEVKVAVQIQEGYRHDLLNRKKLGQLCVRVVQGKNLHRTSSVDTPDPYFVMRYADTWMRSKTCKDTIFPQFDSSMEFDVFEISNILTVALFDDNNMKQKSLKEKISTLTTSRDTLLGKVNIPVNCLVVNKPYRSTFTLFVRRNDKIRIYGEIEIELFFKVKDANALGLTLDILKAYKAPLLPDKYYYEPPSDADVKRLKKTKNDMIIKYMGGQAPTPIRKEACEAVFAASGMEEFKMFRLKMRMERIKAFKNVFGPVFGYVGGAIALVFSWKYPAVTLAFDVVWVFLCFHSHLILPGIFLSLCISSFTYLMAKNFSQPPMATTELLEGIDASSEPSDGSADNEVDTESEAATKNPIKALKAKIEAMQNHALKLQDFVGTIACTFEQVAAIVSWDATIASFAFTMVFFMMFVITYTIPLRYLFAVAGVGLTIKKHPRIADPLPPAPLNLFNRLPSKAHFML